MRENKVPNHTVGANGRSSLRQVVDRWVDFFLEISLSPLLLPDFEPS
jgi:hypothetical protein